jgi:hypothetical protein
VLWEDLPALLRLPPIPRRTAVIAIAVAFLVLLPPSLLYRQEQANEFYFFLDSDDIEALDWIRENSAASAVVATNGPRQYHPDGFVGNAYGWWIEGYARRASLATGAPEDFTFDYQWNAVRDANRIFAGDIVVENGLLRVGMPRSLSMNLQPTVGIGTGADYRTVLYGEAVAVSLANGSVAPSNGTTDLSNSSQIVDGTAYVNASATFNRGAGAPPGRIDATLRVEANESNYRVRVENGSASFVSFSKRLYISPTAALLDVADLGNQTHRMRFALGLKDKSPPGVFDVIVGRGEVGSAVEITWGGDPQGTFVDVRVVAQATSASLSVDLEWLDPRPYGGRPATVQFFSAEALLESHGVTHVFIQQGYEIHLRHFDAQASGFARVFENARVIVYSRV